MCKLKIISICGFVVLAMTPSLWALSDNFDDSSISSEWTVTGIPSESGTLLSCIGGDSITSQTTFAAVELEFGLRNVYDSRNLPDYTKYTLGYAGLWGGSQYILIRNDNQSGGVLAVQVFKGGTVYTLGTVSIGDGQEHDIDITIKLSASELKVFVDDRNKEGLQLVIVETDTNKIPDVSLAFTNLASQVLDGTWDIDYVKTGVIESTVLNDDFDDNIVDTNLWATDGEVTESGTIVACESGESIFSKGKIFNSPIHFTLQGVYDSRNLPDYSKYTLGYSGLYAGNQFLLVRNDNQSGGKLAIQSYKNGTLSTLGTVSVGDGQTHDIDVYMLWDANELQVLVDNVDTSGLDFVYKTTNPNLIPDVPMDFLHRGSQVLNATWNLDFAATESIQSAAIFDDFDDNLIDSNTWYTAGTPVESGTLLSGNQGGDSITSKEYVYFDKISFGLRNFYDNRANADYSKYTIGYTGLLSSRYILARNEYSAQTAGKLNIIVSPRYGVTYSACSLNTSDGQFHDIDVAVDWRPDLLAIEIDDLNTGVGADVVWSTTDVNLIPQEPMAFTHLTNTVTASESFDLDYVQTGYVCGDFGYLPADISKDCYVGLADVDMFVADWLKCNDLADGNCPEFIPEDDSLSGITVYTAVPGTATIDGDLSDWVTNAPWTPMKKVYDGIVVDANNAMFACRYDASADLIYCAVKITDTDQWFNPGNFGWNQQDDIEIYVNGNIAATGSPFGLWDTAQQYVAGYDGSGATWAEWPDSQPVSTSTPDPGLTIFSAVDGNDIVYEFSVKAWDNYTGKGGSGTSVVTDLYEGKAIRFDVVAGVYSNSNFGMLCANTDVSKAYDVELYATLVCTDGKWASYMTTDYTQDNVVNFKDFAEFALEWLSCNEPSDLSCE